MLFRFTGQYTNGHTSISCHGVTFAGREPSDVPAELAERFGRHPEFERVMNDAEAIAAIHNFADKMNAVVMPPKRRGRPKKAAE